MRQRLLKNAPGITVPYGRFDFFSNLVSMRAETLYFRRSSSRALASAGGMLPLSAL
jgi:hypothetical protein